MSLEENPSSWQATGSAESPAEHANPSPQPAEAEIGELLAGMEETSRIAAGQVVKGTVLKVTDVEVLVDIGLKSEGSISLSEFVSGDGQPSVKPGDVVDVWVEEYDEAEGTFTVSHQKAARWRAWDDLERAFQEQKNVSGGVLERTKGGLTVEIGGIRAFLPGSQSDMRPLRDLDSLVGQEIACKVIKLNKSRNNVVVSRKLALEEEASRRRAELLARLEEGKVLPGRVKTLTTYGAFVDLGGMDGLLHVTDLSWGRVSHPSEVVKVGQELQVKVLKYDPEKGRVSLGLKQLTADPWERVSTYQPGDRIIGRVVSLADYGAFVELEPGVEGLIHVSEMSWSKRLKHPSKILKVGDRVEVAVLDVNRTQRRVSLSLRQTLPDPWSTLPERLAVGAAVEGRVRNITDFGAFVEIEEGVDALIHVSDLSWNKNVKHASEVLKKGQKVKGVILSLDPVNRRLSLGIKQLQPDIWEDFFSKTQVGDILRGKIVRMAPFGAFVELREGIEGLCHISEMDENHTGQGPDRAEAGKELDFRVVRLSPAEKRIGLSLKDVEARSEPTPVAQPAPKVQARPQPALSPFAAAMRAALAAPVAAATRAETSASTSDVTPGVKEMPRPTPSSSEQPKTAAASPHAVTRAPDAVTVEPAPPSPPVEGSSALEATPEGGVGTPEAKAGTASAPEAVPVPTSSAAALESSPVCSSTEAADTKGEKADTPGSPQTVASASGSNAGAES